MEKKQTKKSGWILGLLMLGAFALAFQLDCALAQQDTDSDGFWNTVESGGITLPQGMSLATGEPVVPPCGSPRDKCVDPLTQDLFVIIQRNGVCPASTPTCPSTLCGPPLFTNPTSDIPMPSLYANTYNPLGLVYPGVGTIRLGVTTHELLQNPPQNPPYTAQVIGGGGSVSSGGWYAVKVVENLDPCSSLFGWSKVAPPSSSSVATVWPEATMNWIDKTCGQACFDLDGDGVAETCYTPIQANTFVCKNGYSTTSVNMKVSNPNLTPLYFDMLKNVVSHEVSHMMNLAQGSGTTADHHWPTASGVLMEQFLNTKITKSKATFMPDITVTLYISTNYSRGDRDAHQLK